MSEMIEVKTADLIGPALDWATGIADGRELELPSAVRGRIGVVWCDPFVVRREGRPDFHDKTRRKWSPSNDWSQGGPLIEKHRICVTPEYEGQWHADLFRDDDEPLMSVGGATPLIAVCRAVVATEFGLVVSVPKELLPCH